ncbi:MAG: hypothetical protein ABIB47_05210 [Candidatus Woesearchaeota archaeon]
MEKISKISFCGKCGKLLYVRNLCTVCSMNFGNMKPKELKRMVEDMNKQRMDGFDFNSKCELCGMDSEMQYEGTERWFCVDCRLAEE